jgi:pimeloyl-ACP methyl ester carboxylesterase
VLPLDLEEVPVFFPTQDGHTLFGVLVRPIDETKKPAVVIAPGGWYGTSTARNRLVVRMSRALASHGHPSFSFDYHGIGDSGGASPRFQMKNLFTEDLYGAIRALEDRGYEEIVLVGVCYGGRVAASCAHSIKELRGVALVSVPLGQPGDGGGKTAQTAARTSAWRLARKAANPIVLRGLMDHNMRHSYGRIIGAKWRATTGRRRTGTKGDTMQLSDSLAAIVERRVPLLILYGADDNYLRTFTAASEGRLGRVLFTDHGNVEVRTLPGNLQSFSSVGSQEAVIEAVSNWITEQHARGSAWTSA